MKLKPISVILLSLALCAGLIFGAIDTSINWDDTGITALLIFTSSFLFTFLKPSFALLFALLIGGTVFIFNVMLQNNYGSFLAIIISCAGAFTCLFIKHGIRSFQESNSRLIK